MFWTDRANYSEWAEEMIGMREILIKYVNTPGSQVLSRDNLVGMRAPYVKPGGDSMYEMAHDFGLLYDSSAVAPRSNTPLWPFTLDYRLPYDCSNNKKPRHDVHTNNDDKEETDSRDSGTPFSNRGGPSRQKRDANEKAEKVKSASNPKKAYDYPLKYKNVTAKSRPKRQSPFLGRPIKCPTKSFPGLWEVPINPLFDDFNTCHHADQCVFPSNEDTDDTDPIFEFLLNNFERHYNSNRAPFQLNFHVSSELKVKINYITRKYESLGHLVHLQTSSKGVDAIYGSREQESQRHLVRHLPADAQLDA